MKEKKSITIRRNKSASKTDRKHMKQRTLRIEWLFASLPSSRSLKLLGTPGKLPLIHLFVASQQYIFGFYENSILNSAFAAEYSLLLRLNEKLKQEEKMEIAKTGGLGFSEAIKKSTGSLIDKKLAKDLKVLNNLRNMAAHPSNWVTLFKQLDQNLFLNQKAMENWISKVTKKSKKAIAGSLNDELDIEKAKEALERLRAFKDKRFGKLPELEWAAHRSTLRAQTNIVKEYSEGMITDLILNKNVIQMVKKPSGAANYIQKRYPYPEELAIKAMEIAHNTIKRLGFLTDQ